MSECVCVCVCVCGIVACVLRIRESGVPATSFIVTSGPVTCVLTLAFILQERCLHYTHSCSNMSVSIMHNIESCLSCIIA